MGLSAELTPLEISEYKRKWKPDAISVRIHSDLADRAKTWCRRNLDRTQWSMDTWTDVYEHTFHFKDPIDSDVFIKEFEKWCNLPTISEEYY